MSKYQVKITWILMSFLVISGCGTPGKKRSSFTQAQLNAIETREIDASLQETFEATVNAVLDAGYTIAMSDKDAGIVTGTRSEDKTAERIWISHGIKDVAYVITIKIRPIEERRCTARIITSINGEARVDKDAIDAIWHLMQRQVLMKEPPEIQEASS